MPVASRRLLVSMIAAALSIFAASKAMAQTPMRPFGAGGEVAISDLVGVRTGGLGFLSVVSPASGSFGPVGPPAISGLIGYERNTVELPPEGRTTMTINSFAVAPSFDVFVGNRISLGLTAGFGYGWGDVQYPPEQGFPREMGKSMTFGIAPRVGYVVPLGAGFYLWPRVGGGFTYTRAETFNEVQGGEPLRTSVTGGTRWSGGADVGVIFRPTRHLFFNATPEIAVQYGSNGQEIAGATTFITHSLRVRFAGTVGMGVLLGG